MRMRGTAEDKEKQTVLSCVLDVDDVQHLVQKSNLAGIFTQKNELTILAILWDTCFGIELPA